MQIIAAVEQELQDCTTGAVRTFNGILNITVEFKEPAPPLPSWPPMIRHARPRARNIAEDIRLVLQNLELLDTGDIVLFDRVYSFFKYPDFSVAPFRIIGRGQFTAMFPRFSASSGQADNGLKVAIQNATVELD